MTSIEIEGVCGNVSATWKLGVQGSRVTGRVPLENGECTQWVTKNFRVLNDPMILGCFRLIYSNLVIDWG